MSQHAGAAAPERGGERGGARGAARPHLGGLPHLRALDGYRGIGVVAVMLFHLDLVPGGWLGVDLFFVLSGFLITRLLVHERAERGSTDLVGFWRRRGRRLLPALVVLLAGVALYASWYPDPILLPPQLPQQMLAATFYVANWFDLASGGGYWDQYTIASPLKHMWSLAIEEQFYVLFPLVMALLFRFRGPRHRLAWVLGAGTLASWALGIVLLASGSGFERVYLGTDTRVGAVLCGATAGYLSCHRPARERLGRWALALCGPALILALVAMVVVDGSAAWPPGRWLLLPVFELCVVALLLAALEVSESPTGPRSRARSVGVWISALVSSRGLTWLGTISYGLYLWHLPVLLVAQRAFVDSPRAVVVVVTVAASLAIAQASYRLVERPIRVGGLAIAPRFSLGVAAVVLLAGSFVTVVRATEPAREHRDERGTDTGATRIVEAAPDPTASSTRPPDAEPGSPGAPTATSPPMLPAATLPLPRPEGRDPRILLLGDSVAMDLADAFDEAGDELRFVPSSSALIGCGLGGIAPDPTGANELRDERRVRQCDAWMATRAESVRRAQPDVVLITRRSGREPAEGSTVCDPGYLEWYRDELGAEIAELGAEGATVAVASVLYVRIADAQIDAVDDEVDCLNGAIRATVQHHPRAVYLPLNEWVCPSRDGCIEERDGVELRPDGLHFQNGGADLAVRWIVGSLFAPPDRDRP